MKYETKPWWCSRTVAYYRSSVLAKGFKVSSVWVRQMMDPNRLVCDAETKSGQQTTAKSSQSLCKLLRWLMMRIFHNWFLICRFVGWSKTILFPGGGPNPVHSKNERLSTRCLFSSAAVSCECPRGTWQAIFTISLHQETERERQRTGRLPHLGWTSILIYLCPESSVCELDRTLLHWHQAWQAHL